MFARAVRERIEGAGLRFRLVESIPCTRTQLGLPERDRRIHTCCAYDPAELGALLDACRRVDAERLREGVASEPR